MMTAAAVAEMGDVVAVQKFAARAGAWLFVLSLLSGGLVAGAMTGTFHADAAIALSAHVTGLLGALFLFAYSATAPWLSFSVPARNRIAWLLVVGSFANLIIGSAKAFPAVHGVGVVPGDSANNVVFGLLNVFVVAPNLLGAVAWAWGLTRSRSP